jgi:hypothetical protein
MRKIFRFKVINAISVCLLCTGGCAHAASADSTINVCSNNVQSGHDNKQQIYCNVYNFVPNPSYTLIESKPPVKNADGTYTAESVIRVDSTYRPGNMVVVAKGDSVKKVDVSCIGCVQQNNIGGVNGKDGSIGLAIENPFGDYTISETLSDLKSHVETRVLFNIHFDSLSRRFVGYP